MTRSLPFFIAIDLNQKMKKLFFDFILSKVLYFVYHARCEDEELHDCKGIPPYILIFVV